MNLKEIKVSASALASSFRGRIPMDEAVGMMVSVQPKYAEYWADVERSVQAGNSLSQSLPAIWPEALVGAVMAGEESGKMEQVFAHITKATEIQLRLRKLLMKLMYPALISLAGLTVFVLIMVLVAPSTARTFRAQNSNGITQLALAMEAFFKPYWMMVLAALAGGAVIGYKWAISDEGKAAMAEMALQVPYLGPGLRDMYFGLWAEYMAMMSAAGITTDRAILLTVNLMPVSLRDGLVAFERDISVNNLSLEEAANSAMLHADDPRQEWPLFVRRAFIVGDRTGDLDGEMQRIAPELLEQGITKISLSIELANIGATVVAGLLAASSFVGIYGPIIGAAKSFH